MYNHFVMLNVYKPKRTLYQAWIHQLIFQDQEQNHELKIGFSRPRLKSGTLTLLSTCDQARNTDAFRQLLKT